MKCHQPSCEDQIAGSARSLGTRLVFVDISLAGSAGFCSASAANALQIKDCSLHAAKFTITGGNNLPTLGFTNNIIERCDLILLGCYGPYFANFYNNLFLNNGNLGLAHACGGSIVQNFAVRDNLFVRGSFTYGGGGYTPVIANNGFYQTTVTSYGSNPRILTTTPDFQSGPLGGYYYPTTGGNLSQLIDAGSMSASAAGLRNYTVLVDQTPEKDTFVDIGFHYFAVNAVLVSGNNADGGPFANHIRTYDFATGALVNSFLPSGALGAKNGRGLAIHDGKFFYTDLVGRDQPSDGIHVVSYGIQGSGGTDYPTLPNPRQDNGQQDAGIQDLAFQGNDLFVLTGYPDKPLWVYKLDPNTGSVQGGPIVIADLSIGGPAYHADGFTVLPNTDRNFLLNNGDRSPIYREYNSTTGDLAPSGVFIDLGAFGLAHGRGVAITPDGLSLYFAAESASSPNFVDTIVQTDLHGHLIGFQSISRDFIEDIDVATP